MSSKSEAPPNEPEPEIQAEAEEPIPKLPRAPLIGKLSTPALVRIGMFGTLFYAVIVMRKPCAEGAGRFVMSFDESAQMDAGREPKAERFPGFELMTAEEALKRFPDAPVFDAGLGDAGTRDSAASAKSAAAKTSAADSGENNSAAKNSESEPEATKP